MGFFSSALGKQRHGEEKESKQTTTQAFPLCRSGSFSNHHLLGREPHSSWNPAQFAFQRYLTQKLSPVKIWSLQPESTTQLHFWTVVILDHSFRSTFTARSWNWAAETLFCAQPPGRQRLVGQWLISQSYGAEVRSKVKGSAIQFTGAWVIRLHIWADKVPVLSDWKQRTGIEKDIAAQRSKWQRELGNQSGK